MLFLGNVVSYNGVFSPNEVHISLFDVMCNVVCLACIDGNVLVSCGFKAHCVEVLSNGVCFLNANGFGPPD